MKWIDLTGNKIGKLFIIDGNLPDRLRVLVRCDCGNELLMNKNNILQGRTKSCGRGVCHVEFKNLKGRVFGRLTVIKLLGKHAKRNINIWECLCTCGKTIVSYSDRLENGNTKSCGCFVSQFKSFYTEDAYINSAWNSYYNSSKNRGLIFELSFDEFVNLIHQECHYCGFIPPFKKRNGIDRVDNDKGYLLDNCVSACSNCNFAKRQLPYGKFINLIKKISDRFRNVIIPDNQTFIIDRNIK